MFIDPGEAMQDLWVREIIEKNSPLDMWNLFTDVLVSDEDSIKHLIRNQGHIVRMHYYFVLLSFLPFYIGGKERYLVAVNNEDYLMSNLLCIQSVNSNLAFSRHGDTLHVSLLPVIFKIGEFSDSNTYRIPTILGGSRFAYEIFASSEDEE